MKFFAISDIHIDFWIDEWKQLFKNLEEVFDNFYKQFMSPSENLIIAGDISNDYFNYVEFVNFISKKYEKVYICFGNHDGCVNGHTFGNGNPFSDTFEKFDAIIEKYKNTNVVILDAIDKVDEICGCMGMCDFTYKANFLSCIQYNAALWKKNWFDSKVWKMKEFTNDYKIDPNLVWNKYKQEMMNRVKLHPKIMVTHFCPIQLGIQREFESSSTTSFFYFDGKEFLEEMENDSYWICGHIHMKLKYDYVNSKGNTIHILSVPSGYPGEDPSYSFGYKINDCLIEV